MGQGAGYPPCRVFAENRPPSIMWLSDRRHARHKDPPAVLRIES